MIEDKITVLISSCDSYSILWDDFEAFFKKNWQLDCEVILVSETLKINGINRYHFCCNGNGVMYYQ